MNLPPSYNLFVGRTRELVEIQDALHRFRLVTLTGSGGCGKTRLALEYVRQSALAASPRDTPLAIRLLQDATPLYTGDSLPELDADWIMFRREELRHMALEALLKLGRLLSEEARQAEAMQMYQRVLELDDYLEVAHRELRRCYARQGDASRARRQFRQPCDLLRKELGTEPSPETVRLDEQIRAGHEI